jgi:hypothetical protein
MHRFPLLSAVAAGVIIAAGCHRNPDAGASAGSSATGLRGAFTKAEGPGKELAADAASALESGNDVKAFDLLSALTSQSDLTPEQRASAMQAMTAEAKKLAEAAKNGNSDAEKALTRYRASK